MSKEGTNNTNGTPPEGTTPPAEPEKGQNVKQRRWYSRVWSIFKWTMLVLVVLLLLLFGFTQTSTFRNFLRDKLVSIANSSLDGSVSIGEIDGTIFTSLIIRDASLQYEADTVASVDKLELYFSPHRLLYKEILVRNLSVEGLDANLQELEDGELNLMAALPESEKEIDTTASEPFDFAVDIRSFSIKRSSFVYQTYENRGSGAAYDTLNTGDLRLSDISLELFAEVAMADTMYFLELDELAFTPNIRSTGRVTFSGDIALTANRFSLEGLELVTDNSEIRLDASSELFRFFSGEEEGGITGYPVEIDFAVTPFSFTDLAAFVPAASMMKGDITGELLAEGSLQDLAVERLQLGYGQTELKVSGRAASLTNIDKMNFDLLMVNSTLLYKDLQKMMPSLELPSYPSLPPLAIDTLAYKGGLERFASRLRLRAGKGLAVLMGEMDMRRDLTYSLSGYLRNFNLEPVADYPLLANVKRLHVEGRGTNPKTLESRFDMLAGSTLIGGTAFDTLRVRGSMENGEAVFTTTAIVDTQRAYVEANLNLNSEPKPTYSFNGRMDRFDLGNIVPDSTLQTSLNVYLKGSAEGFEPDLITGDFSLAVVNSSINNEKIKDVNIDFELSVPEPGQKEISLVSNVADVDMSGTFDFGYISELVTVELGQLSETVIRRTEVYFPAGIDTLLAAEADSAAAVVATEKAFIDTTRKVKLTYDVSFKDLSVLNYFLEGGEVAADGNIFGGVSYDTTGFNLEVNMRINSGWFGMGDTASYYIQDAGVNFNLLHAVEQYALEDYESYLIIETPELLTRERGVTSAYTDLYLQSSLAAGELAGWISAQMDETVGIALSYNSDFGADTLTVESDTLRVTYNDYTVSNKQPMAVSFQENNITIDNFNLFRGESSALIRGYLSTDAGLNLDVEISDIRARDIGEAMFGLRPDEIMMGRFNVSGTIKGTSNAPEIQLYAKFDDMKYQGQELGRVFSLVSYRDKRLYPDIRFYARQDTSEGSPLVVSGYLPVDLSLAPKGERFPLPDEVSLSLFADGFDLSAFGNAVPFLEDIGGTLNADLDITGVYPDLNQAGNLEVIDGMIVPSVNNIRYGLALLMNLKGSSMTLDHLRLSNTGDVERQGELVTKGSMEFDGFSMAELDLEIEGGLTFLADKSESVSPDMYGPVFVSTSGPLNVGKSGKTFRVNGDIVVEEADLTLLTEASGYKGGEGSIIYKYVEYESEDSRPDLYKRYESSAIDAYPASAAGGGIQNLVVNLGVSIEEETYGTVILAKEADSKLIAQLEGDLRYRYRDGEQSMQGELKLLDESKLDIANLKTFTAAGSVRFERDIMNPYLNITATYTSYVVSGSGDTQTEELAAVKLKIDSPYSELSENLLQSQGNLTVYVGESNIRDDVPDESYDETDAAMFILTGNLARHSAGGGNMFQGAATSVAGSLLSGFLHSQFGDYVRSVELRQASTGGTVFALSGKIENIRYSFGGRTDVFQNFSDATIRIEYPIVENLLVRLERKMEESQQALQYNMINEIGLKYRFEF